MIASALLARGCETAGKSGDTRAESRLGTIFTQDVSEATAQRWVEFLLLLNLYAEVYQIYPTLSTTFRRTLWSISAHERLGTSST